jgi:hypothetical protein
MKQLGKYLAEALKSVPNGDQISKNIISKIYGK